MKQKLEALGHWFFYMAMHLFGHIGGLIMLRPVVFVYVLFSRKVHSTTFHYLKRRFPGRSKGKYWWYTYKSIISFGHVLVDRGWLGVKKNAKMDGEFIGLETLLELIERKKGVVLLTGHVGNWQSAFAELGGLPVTVHSLMKYEQGKAAKHYFDLQKKERSFEIIDAEGPFGGMVDAAAALGRGEIVTIMGDRFIKGSSSETTFLGDTVRVPDAAYQLAATAGAPVVILLTAKTGAKRFEVRVWDHFYPQYKSRDQRGQMLQECSGRYIQILEKYLKSYPFQWYNFYDFWKQ